MKTETDKKEVRREQFKKADEKRKDALARVNLRVSHEARSAFDAIVSSGNFETGKAAFETLVIDYAKNQKIIE